jgi:hypothetical protein
MALRPGYGAAVASDPHRRVLSDAFDGAQLVELLRPVVNNPSAPLTRIEPMLTLAHAISAVREALLAGDIYLSDVAHPDIPLYREEALVLIEDQQTWNATLAPRVLLLNLTDDGEEKLAAFGGHC